jgi:nicotinamide mononucleotide adenylyltransferase
MCRCSVAGDESLPRASFRNDHSHESARLIEFETRTAWQELVPISVAEVAQKVRLNVPRRKELLLAAFAFLASAKKLLV